MIFCSWRQGATLALAVLVAAVLSLSVAPARAEEEAAEKETKQQRDARMKWWREARFGMFIHWGIYSVPAGTYQGKKIEGIGEWIMHFGKVPVEEYKSYAKEFNPVKFNADEWVSLAKEAGQKYIVITSKHHDGFAMYHSKSHPFNIMDATPFKRDPLKELAAACQKHGVKLGFYYSQAQDWTAPGGATWRGPWDEAQKGSMDKYIEEKAVPQVKEILTEYGPIAVLWWDTPIDMNKERAEKLLPLLKLQPGIIWNNRLGGGYRGDSETPEQTIPATGFKDRDWETCMTMNDTWGYKSYDQNWKPTERLLRNLIDIASKGGNYLLNVGPTAEGEIPSPSVERLKEMGKWLAINGEAIYATSANPFRRPPAWGRVTRKPGKLFLHVFDWPQDGKLKLEGLNVKVEKAYFLADKDRAALKFSHDDGTLSIDVPPQALDPIATVVAVEFAGDLQTADPTVNQAADGKVTLGAIDAEIHGNMTKYEESPGGGNIGYWRQVGDWLSWEARITKPGKFSVALTYACAQTSAGSVLGIEVVGAGKLSFTTADTGGWNDYRTVDLGQVMIDKAGTVTITVRPEKKPGEAVMNLRSIVLTPAK